MQFSNFQSGHHAPIFEVIGQKMKNLDDLHQESPPTFLALSRIDVDIVCCFSVVNFVKVHDNMLVSDVSDRLISVILSVFENTFFLLS